MKEPMNRLEPAASQRAMTRREALKAGLAGAAALSTGAVSVSDAVASTDSREDLIAAAKAEGQLTVIGLPRDWCGYGGVIDGFRTKYGLTINELQPDASSADQIDAIKAGRDTGDPKLPMWSTWVCPSPRRRSGMASCGRTKCPPGTKFRRGPRMPKGIGMAAIAGSLRSRSTLTW